MKPTWIWLFGDFAIHQRLLCDTRRLERNFYRPAPWHLDDCYHNVVFCRQADLSEPEEICVLIDGIGSVRLDGHYHQAGKPFTVPAGKHWIHVEAANLTGVPAIYVTGTTIVSDESWGMTHDNLTPEPVECWNFDDPACPPSRFAFPAHPIALKEVILRGVPVLDAGEETFCRLRIFCEGEGRVRVYLGESEAEVLSSDPYIWFEAAAAPVIEHTALAMRYLRTETEGDCRVLRVEADYERPDLRQLGSFSCSDPLLNEIMRVSVHTLALNCREVILDGIKRDRYCWSGDAYQSYLLNYYLYFDRDLCRRTILALRGKDPMTRHINTIMDYTFYWILSVADYRKYTGDTDFVRKLFPRLRSLTDFCIARTDAEGLAAPQNGDWIFVDWSEYLDKEGPIAIEQMLFCRCLELTARLCEEFGEDPAPYASRAERLAQIIEERYFDPEKGAYIDSYVSGRRNLSRQTNLFALRYGFAVGERAKRITALLEQPGIGPITTPYFKFYEIEALAAQGEMARVTERIRSYWGGMLAEGATSFWEEYHPEMQGEEHLHMYGTPFGKSLCHAWGASPIYLFGRFYLGVEPTGDGYCSFTVKPNLGGLDFIRGTVPTPHGVIEVYADREAVEVFAPMPGGTLIADGKELAIEPGKRLRIATK